MPETIKGRQNKRYWGLPLRAERIIVDARQKKTKTTAHLPKSRYVNMIVKIQPDKIMTGTRTRIHLLDDASVPNI